MKDLRSEQQVCVLLSVLLDEISEEGPREGCLSTKDALGASSRILKNLSRSLEDAGRVLATWQ